MLGDQKRMQREEKRGRSVTWSILVGSGVASYKRFSLLSMALLISEN